MSTLAVIVTTAPNSHLTQTAFQLISQATSQSIDIVGVFFYQQGVLNASQLLSVPSDEYPLCEKWQQLNADSNIPLYLCSTAAEKHGLINELKPQSTEFIHNAFTLAGLGELVELTAKADKVVQL